MQYVAIAAHFAADALPQLSQHFFRQAGEENEHAMPFIKYVVDAGGRVLISAIDAPQASFKTAEAAIKLSLDQEVKRGSPDGSATIGCARVGRRQNKTPRSRETRSGGFAFERRTAIGSEKIGSARAPNTLHRSDQNLTQTRLVERRHGYRARASAQ
jgi:hypothetical protein